MTLQKDFKTPQNIITQQNLSAYGSVTVGNDTGNTLTVGPSAIIKDKSLYISPTNTYDATLSSSLLEHKSFVVGFSASQFNGKVAAVEFHGDGANLSNVSITAVNIGDFNTLKTSTDGLSTYLSSLTALTALQVGKSIILSAGNHISFTYAAGLTGNEEHIQLINVDSSSIIAQLSTADAISYVPLSSSTWTTLTGTSAKGYVTIDDVLDDIDTNRAKTDLSNISNVTGTVTHVYTITTTAGDVAFSPLPVTADQRLFDSVVTDSGILTASSTTDTLTISGGDRISTSISGDKVMISVNNMKTDAIIIYISGGDYIAGTLDDQNTYIHFQSAGRLLLPDNLLGHQIALTNESALVVSISALGSGTYNAKGDEIITQWGGATIYSSPVSAGVWYGIGDLV